ncbi:hypothetical protein HY478_04020 [Candidatus Uhrbacteria bacterium]|nr:hypothetical protein [Candidatus Uhrbacteria bacterium]
MHTTLTRPTHATVTPMVEALAFRAGRTYLESRGYTELFPPRIVRASGACENIDTLFSVAGQNDARWWRDATTDATMPAYLAQTAQLYLEAHVPELERVYCVGPSFRAEPAIDGRHLSEFTMVEIELAGDFDALLAEIEGFVTAVHDTVSARTRAPHLAPLAHPFARASYDEAINVLRMLGEDIEWGGDISRTQEALLIRTSGGGPLFITHFPDPMWDHGKQIEVEKFFNMTPDPARPGRVQSADLILPISGEAVGAAARVHEPDMMRARLRGSRMFKRLIARGGSIEDFRWYLDRLEEQGSVPHAGCGFGMARVLQWLRGTEEIADAVTFPCHRASLI